MQNVGPYMSQYGVEKHGIKNAGTVYWNLTTPMLYEEVVHRGEGLIAQSGPLIVNTGQYTGRSPRDKFVVREPSSEDEIWWGKVNQPLPPEHFERLRAKMLAYIQNRDIFVFDGYAGADPRYRMPIRVITEYAWHSLFARNMFIRESQPEKLTGHVPVFTVIDLPRLHADPAEDGTRTQTFIVVNFDERLVIIGGTEYAGEIKKSIFTALNYYLPKQGVLSMHCSANHGGQADDTALFFGLSGTGKTTLSNDSARILIGDDEHGWSDDGIFNFEGGCYAKVIRLDAQGEPEIYATTQRFGTILENVVYAPDTRHVDLDDGTYTENTRAVYPLSQIGNADDNGLGSHPRNVVFLTADAFGVLPPVSKLSKAQAMYHFLSGYTAKVAGTERGVTEPQPEFSTCFGAPFLPLHPSRYAELLGENIDRHGVQVWLVNTGWTSGPYGVGHRIKLAHTRQIVSAILSGQLQKVETEAEPFFGLQVPVRVPGIPDSLLQPRSNWGDPAAYDLQAAKLVRMFAANFEQFDDVSDEIRAAGPSETRLNLSTSTA